VLGLDPVSDGPQLRQRTGVLISSRVNTFQEAYQAGGMVVVPLVLAQLAGVIFLSPAFAIGLGAFVWLLDAGLI